MRKDFMEPAGLSANALSRALRVTATRVNDILLQRRGITGDTALRLARYFGGDAMDWMALQATYDLRTAEIESGKAIDREVAPRDPPLRKTPDRSGR